MHSCVIMAPLSACGNGECELEESCNKCSKRRKGDIACFQCAKDCCKFKDTLLTALVIASIFLVPIIIVVVVILLVTFVSDTEFLRSITLFLTVIFHSQYYAYYRKRKLLQDNSWIISYSDIKIGM